MLKAGTVYLVGAGPGDPGLITVRGLEVLREAEVIIHDRLANPQLLLEARADARLVYVGKESSNHALPQDEINRLLAAEAQAGHSVCRLKGGDPFLFGRGGEEADHLRAQGIPFEVVPGVTSALAAPAYAGIPVTDRRAASSLAIMTGHAGSGKQDSVDWRRLAAAADTLVVLMGTRNLPEITLQMLEAGRDPALPAAVIRWGTTGRQRVLVSDLAGIADEVARRGFAAPAVLVVGEVAGFAGRLAWFGQGPLQGLRVLVTRPRGQAGALPALLRARGAEPIVCALQRIEPIPVPPESTRALMSQPWDWLLFTSANGVETFSGCLLAAGLDWRALGRARLGAIGPGTASALTRLGLRADCIPASAVAETLAQALPEVGPDTRVLLPRAAGAREALPALLGERGAAVEVVETYRAVPDEAGIALAKAALAEAEVDVATFASSSAVTTALDLLGRTALEECDIACIGPVTAATAREAGLRVAVEATEHTMPGLVAALEEYAARRPAAVTGRSDS